MNDIVKSQIGTIEVWTDGSLHRVKEGDICGYGVFFPGRELKDISAAFTIEPITNNRAELYAIYKAISKIEKKYDFEKIIINTDSEYSTKSLTVWIHKWKKNQTLPFHRMGRKIYFKRSELINSLKFINDKRKQNG